MSYRTTRDALRGTGFAPGDRPKGDFYATPRIAVEQLLRVESFGTSILEPCCGNGAIAECLSANGYLVTSRDLHDWGYGSTGIDFLTSPVEDFDAVVTNPPFNLSLKFAEQALAFTKAREGKVAMLNRLQWLEGQKRKLLFNSTPLAAVHVFSKRLPRMHRFDFTGEPSTSLLAFAWFVWDWKFSGAHPIVTFL